MIERFKKFDINYISGCIKYIDNNYDLCEYTKNNLKNNKKYEILCDVCIFGSCNNNGGYNCGCKNSNLPFYFDKASKDDIINYLKSLVIEYNNINKKYRIDI